MFHFTREQVRRWAGPQQYAEGTRDFEQGIVKSLQVDADWVLGVLAWGDRTLTTRLRVLRDGTVDSACPCRDARERGLICSHVVAAGLALAAELADPRLDRELRITRRREKEKMSGLGLGHLRRVPQAHPAAMPAELQLWLALDWRETAQQGNVLLAIHVLTSRGRERVDRVGTNLPLSWSRRDEQLLYLLEDIAGGPVPPRLKIPLEGFLHLLTLLAPGVILMGDSRESVHVRAEGVVPLVQVSLDAASGEVVVEHRVDGAGSPLVLATRRLAWVYSGGSLSPLAQTLPPTLQSAYGGPMRIPRRRVPTFLQTELLALEERSLVDAQVCYGDLSFAAGVPRFRLVLRGGRERMQPILYAVYGDRSAVAGRGLPDLDFIVPDDAAPLRYLHRDEQAEQAGLSAMGKFGLTAEVGDRFAAIERAPAVMDFLGRIVPAIRSDGIEVGFEGELEEVRLGARWLEPHVQVKSAGEGWFDISFQCSDGEGGSVTLDEIDAALRAGVSHLDRDGRTLLLDRQSLTDLTELITDTDDETRNSWRISAANAGYLMALLRSLRGVQVAADDTVDAAARQQNRESDLAAVVLPADLERILRGYQRDGIRWLRFLEVGGFGGILADDMGLGKTIQALAWLQLQRIKPELRDLPSLVVCPTSLIENWALESARFTPDLKVVVVAGADRHRTWDALPSAGLVITSYALLRRDIARHAKVRYAAAVLDEAQHIKNRSTQNAKASKALATQHRLVLTGTPIENGVADLWSIMDFVMPGYLGRYERFRESYELPIATGGEDGRAAQARLRKKLHPFLLRRLKREVATELPPRLERVAYCTMTRDQRNVYALLLEQAQQEVTSLVSTDGFARSRMAVFRTLTRLRQVCCHLGLLKLPNLKADEPSAKLDLFMELIEEAMDGGHRVLVFSQFVSMLAILKEELRRVGVTFCYLDGQTKDRINVVNRFNREADVPVFLISLKAGGTGLNLTGADTVIHFDPWWNPAVEDQATDRAHRIGQEKTVYAIKLITRDSVEEKVLSLQQRKRGVIEAALAREELSVEKLTWEDVRELLSL